MKSEIKDGILTIYLKGRINSTNAEKVKSETEDMIKAYPGAELVLDAGDLRYISSAGIRVLLHIQSISGVEKLTIQNVTRDVYDLLSMTGLTKLMNIERKLREIDISKARTIGSGRSSTVYRIENETIVKLYTDGVPLEKIKQELYLAKEAFLAGIPTPLSYDLVKCGDAYGVVFEMLDHADTVGHTLTENPDRFDEIMKKFVDAFRIVHHVKLHGTEGIESVKKTWESWADGMQANGSYTAEETAALKKMIAAVPDRDTMVHCDFHAGNVMYQNGEIVVIDMADIGYGHPVFDFAAGAFHARYSDSPTRQKVHGMDQENMLRFWDTLLSLYFDVKDKADLAGIKEIFDAFGLLRGALFPMKHIQISPELKAFHVGETRKHLFPRMDWALSQAGRLAEIFEEDEAS